MMIILGVVVIERLLDGRRGSALLLHVRLEVVEQLTLEGSSTRATERSLEMSLELLLLVAALLELLIC